MRTIFKVEINKGVIEKLTAGPDPKENLAWDCNFTPKSTFKYQMIE